MNIFDKIFYSLRPLKIKISIKKVQKYNYNSNLMEIKLVSLFGKFIKNALCKTTRNTV